MKQICLSTALLLFTIISQAQNNDRLLFNAYETHSASKLQLFFENWAAETPGMSTKDFSALNDTAKNIYLLFEAFYNPSDITKSGGSEWGNNIYRDTKYFILQDAVRFAITDSIYENFAAGDMDATKQPVASPEVTHYFILKKFRPQLSFPGAHCVSLTKHYQTLLNRFLGDKHLKPGTGNIMLPARSTGESENRKQFLEKDIKIWYGHWGGYWQLYTYPVTATITFDKKFQTAIINYVMIYEGGYAYFKKSASGWVLIKAERTWIE